MRASPPRRRPACLVRHHQCAGGIQISASHNPAEYNGLKLFSAEGRVVPAVVGEAVLERYRMQDAGRRSESRIERRRVEQSRRYDVGTPCTYRSESSTWTGFVRGGFACCSMPIMVRAACWAGRCWSGSAANVTVLGGEPDGQFAHEPEPTAENLGRVLTRVTQAGADVGFCQDPDADRLAIIDEHGRYSAKSTRWRLCVDHVLRSTPGPVVTNCSTSRMTEDLARKYGVPFSRSAVGEANVVDEMLRESAVIGGEGNGGVIDPRVVLVRDSFVGMALVLDAMAERNRAGQRAGRRVAAIRDSQNEGDARREKQLRRRSMRWSATFQMRPAIGSTACGSIGRKRTAAAAGSWCAPATPSRSCGSSPKRRPQTKRSDYAMRLRSDQRCEVNDLIAVRPGYLRRFRFLGRHAKRHQIRHRLAAEGVEHRAAGGEDVGDPVFFAVFFEGRAAFAAADVDFDAVVGHPLELRDEARGAAFEPRVFEHAEHAVVERDRAVQFDELADGLFEQLARFRADVELLVASA